MGRLVLSGRGRRRVQRGHPWIYANDVAAGEGQPGELLSVLGPDEVPLGWGLFSSASKIAVRLVTRDEAQPDRAFWKERMERAVGLRTALGYDAPEGSCRLLSGDADGFPGLVVDRYADVLVLQSGCQGSDRMRDFLLELLLEVLPAAPRAVLDRSDASTRRLEALEPRVEWVRGGPLETVLVEDAGLPSRTGVPPRTGGPSPRLVHEVALTEGHKTGHYLDQRENRRRAARFAPGARVLDAFSYDGLFGLHAALAGAESVLCLEQSAAACERLARNAERNGVAGRLEVRRCNAMHALRDLAQEGPSFGLVVVDPPAFARNKREAEGALRGYRELNLRALTAVAPGGVVVSASCSYNVDRGAFLGCIADAARDARREARLLEVTGAAPDHPVSPALPESEYLKCAFLWVS